MIPLVLALLGGIFTLGRIEVAGFERDAAKELASRLRGAPQVEVKAKVGPECIWGDVAKVSINASSFESDGMPLFTEPKRSHQGIVRDLEVRLTDFSIGGLRIESLSASLLDSRFDFPLAVRKRQIRLSRSGAGPGQVVVTANDLAAFVLKKYKFVQRCQIDIESDKIYVEGYGDFGFFKSDFRLVAKFEPVDGSKLMLTFAKIAFDGVPVDDARRDVMIKAINPVVDLDRDLGLHGALYVEKLVLRDGRITAIGKARIPDLPDGLVASVGKK